MAVNNVAYPYTIAGANGTSGATISYTGTTASWTQPTSNFHDGTMPVMTIPHGGQTVVLEEKATLEVKGSVKINGVDLEERLTTIETMLQIPTRDVTMEAKHPRLAELYKQYMHELEKYRTWDRVKGETK